MKILPEGLLWPAEDNGFAWPLIRRHAKRLTRSTELSVFDQDDFEQTLAMELWQSRASYDPRRGSWEGFATTVVRHAAGKLVRNQRRKKRDDRSTISLSTPVNLPSGEPMELAQTITQQDRGRHLGVDSPIPEVHADLTLDLAEFSSTLPEAWTNILMLCRTASNAEVTAQTGMKRPTLFDLKQKISKQLRTAGFEKYLEN